MKARLRLVRPLPASSLLVACLLGASAVGCADAVLEAPDGGPGGADMFTGAIPPPPDKPGTRPQASPPPEGEVPPEGEIPPEGEEIPDKPPEAVEEDPPDNCRGVDFLGQCHGTLAVWCDENELYAYDCAEDGQACGFIDGEIGYYCLPDSEAGEPPPEAPPEGPEVPPEGVPWEPPPPEPADPCPGVDWFGRCEGDVAIWCDDEEEILQFNCTWIGMVCRDLLFLGHRCVLPENAPMDPGTPGGDPGGTPGG